MRVLPSFLGLSAAALCSFDNPGREMAAQWPAGLVYAWRPQAQQTLAARFPAPAGCLRIPVPAGSWGEWLRWLPLKPAGTKARLYNGQLKGRQDVVAARS